MKGPLTLPRRLVCLHPERMPYVTFRELPKPRARWNDRGIGYWTAHTVENGTIYQGVGRTLPEAYSEWVRLHET